MDYDTSFSFINEFNSRMGLALLITPTSSSKAFCAVSLAYNNRINADNSYTKIVIMLVAACFKNSSSETLRNRT